MQLTPLADLVIIKPKEKENVSTSGIIINTEDKPEADIGKVIAVGPDVDDSVKAGDTVCFSKFAGDDFDFDDGKEKALLKIVRLDSILAIIVP